MKKRPTILDVARQAGVSKSTVSLVHQNSSLVKQSTREEVARAIDELGYVYNRSAAGLRGAASGLIGLQVKATIYFKFIRTSFVCGLSN